MDFPGTINTDFEHFMHQVLDITKSLAYHGFKKIILLNGHGSNMPNLDLVARRTNLETDAECVPVAWWNLLTVDKEFLPRWRESKFPGGCAHACELETSLYLYLDGDNVRKDKIKNGTIRFNEEDSPFNWVDLFAAGPATVISWTSSYSETGVLGEPELATAEKGRQAYEEAVKQLVRFVTGSRTGRRTSRRDRHRTPPTMPIPWGQASGVGDLMSARISPRRRSSASPADGLRRRRGRVRSGGRFRATVRGVERAVCRGSRTVCSPRAPSVRGYEDLPFGAADDVSEEMRPQHRAELRHQPAAEEHRHRHTAPSRGCGVRCIVTTPPARPGRGADRAGDRLEPGAARADEAARAGDRRCCDIGNNVTGFYGFRPPSVSTRR